MNRKYWAMFAAVAFSFALGVAAGGAVERASWVRLAGEDRAISKDEIDRLRRQYEEWRAANPPDVAIDGGGTDSIQTIRIQMTADEAMRICLRGDDDCYTVAFLRIEALKWRGSNSGVDWRLWYEKPANTVSYDADWCKPPNVKVFRHAVGPWRDRSGSTESGLMCWTPEELREYKESR